MLLNNVKTREREREDECDVSFPLCVSSSVDILVGQKEDQNKFVHHVAYKTPQKGKVVFTIFHLKCMMFLVTLYFPSLFFFFSQSYHHAYIHELYSYCVLCLKVINSLTSFSCRLKQFFQFFFSQLNLLFFPKKYATLFLWWYICHSIFEINSIRL